MIETAETLRRSVALEMDLRLEAAALSEMAENTKDDPDFRVPTVDWLRTAKDVLTLEWIEGTHLSNHDALRADGSTCRRSGRIWCGLFCVKRCVTDFSTPTCIRALFVDDCGRMVAVDFGIMGPLGPKERRFLAEILFGFITRNYHRAAEVQFEAGYVPPQHSGRKLRAGYPRHRRTDP